MSAQNANLRVRTKMAQVVVTMKIMPDNPEVDLAKLREEAEKKTKEFGGDVGKVEEEPVAFGLKSLNVLFVMDENQGSTESLEKSVAEIEGVASVEITDVRRAVG